MIRRGKKLSQNIMLTPAATFRGTLADISRKVRSGNGITLLPCTRLPGTFRLSYDFFSLHRQNGFR